MIKLTPPILLISFFALLGGFILILIIKKIFYYTKYKKKYYIFPKINANGIANTSMIIAISIAVIILLTTLSSGLMGIFFRVYPGWRATIEGILIKIGGLLFGPILGILIGAITDILTIALTSGMFHYGFFVICLAYGFFAGLIRIIINVSPKNLFLYILSISSICIVISTLCSLYLFFQYPDGYNISLFSQTFPIPNWLLMVVFIGVQGFFLLLLWFLFLVFEFDLFKINLSTFYLNINYFNKRNKFIKKILHKKNIEINQKKLLNYESKKYFKYKDHINLLNTRIEVFNKKKFNKHSWLYCFIPIHMLICICEPIVEIIMMPLFDTELGGGIPMEYWIAFRMLFLIIINFINLLVVYPIYKTIIKLIKYDYTTDVIKKFNN